MRVFGEFSDRGGVRHVALVAKNRRVVAVFRLERRDRRRRVHNVTDHHFVSAAEELVRVRVADTRGAARDHHPKRASRQRVVARRGRLTNTLNVYVCICVYVCEYARTCMY